MYHGKLSVNDVTPQHSSLEILVTHKKFTFYQWLFLVPLKGGRDYIIPQLAVYTTYILPSGGLYNPYHLLGEPETAIDFSPGIFPKGCHGSVRICALPSFRVRVLNLLLHEIKMA